MDILGPAAGAAGILLAIWVAWDASKYPREAFQEIGSFGPKGAYVLSFPLIWVCGFGLLLIVSYPILVRPRLLRWSAEQQGVSTGSEPVTLDGAVRKLMLPHEEIYCRYKGMSAGLNATDTATRKPSILYITSNGVTVAVGSLLGGRHRVDRFETREILDVLEGTTDMTGMVGAVARANTSTLLGQAMGARDSEPAMLIRSRRGDVLFAFSAKQRGPLREATLAVEELVDRHDRERRFDQLEP